MNGKKARQRHNDVECTQFHVLCERFVKIFDGFARTQQVELATKKKQFHVLCESFVKIFDGFAKTQQVELATKKTMIIPFKLL